MYYQLCSWGSTHMQRPRQVCCHHCWDPPGLGADPIHHQAHLLPIPLHKHLQTHNSKPTFFHFLSSYLPLPVATSHFPVTTSQLSYRISPYLDLPSRELTVCQRLSLYFLRLRRLTFFLAPSSSSSSCRCPSDTLSDSSPPLPCWPPACSTSPLDELILTSKEM